MGLRFRRNEDEDQSSSAGSAEDQYAAITPGVPGRCPDCNGFGYIDHADLVSHTQIQHCRDCGHRWEYRFDEAGNLLEIDDLRDPGTPPERVRYVDLAGATEAPEQPTVGATAAGGDADRADDVVDLTDGAHDKSPGQWLRDVARNT